MNMKKRLLSALTLVALVLQLLGCLPAAAATTTTTTETPEIPKFLIIGNSFAVDAMKSYFRAILKAEGVTEYTIGYLYYAGCTVEQHASFAKDDKAVYEFYKSTASSGWPEDPAADTTMLTALRDEEWDYVFLQQASKKAADPATYNEDIDYLMEYVRQNVPNPGVKFGWHMTWAFSKDLQEATSSMSATTRPVIFESFGRDSQKMYQAIADAVQSNILSRPFSIVIPSGTAVENVRASHIGDTLQTVDGYHLDTKGDLIASYCWYAALTGKTIDSLKYVPSSLGLSEADKAVIVEAVNNAVANPYSITVPTLDDSTVLYSKTSDELYAINSAEERQIITYWGPNTEDVALTTNKVRKDIAFTLWTGITGIQENEDSNYLAHFITKPHYDDAGEFSYGLRSEEDGTPNTLSLTMTIGDDGESLSLDTNAYGEIELTFQHVRRDLVVPTIDTIESGFRVQVSTDGGTTWKEGYAGMKSHRIIAEGRLLSATGNVAKCYEIKSTDLSVLAEGEIINAIRILPYGDFDDFTTENTFVRAISITGYETAAPAEEKVMVDVEEDILRQIVAAHAKRLNEATWTGDEDVMSNVRWADDGSVERAITYYGGVRHSGPIYSGKNASTYERFLSDIDENGNYTGATADDDYGDTGINGMDCITVVYDCLSQVTTSRSASNWYYMFHDLYDEEDNPNGKVVPLYTAAGRGNIDRDTTDTYFGTLISTEEGEADMYALYDALRPGDFITNSGHTRVITSDTADGNVYVGETAGGTIQHHYRLTNGEEESFVKPAWNADPEIYVRANPDTVSEHLYSTSMRYNREISTETICNTLYLPYTLREYTTGQVEKENVLITTNSVDHPTDFITNGFCAAIDSNYTIRTLAVTLTDKDTGASLWTDTVYGLQSDFSYLFSGERADANGVTLNTALATLEGAIGQYELKVEVLSGPRIYLEDGSVINDVSYASDTVNPTTTFTYNLSSQHTQTVGEVENGTVMLNKTGAQYGDTVIVTAVPDPSYELEAICVDGTAITGNTFTVSGAHEVTATFVPATYTVTVTEAEHGTVTVDKSEGSYGDTVTVTANPAEGYELKHILVNGYAIEDNTFPITRNQIVTAEFEPISYTVNVTGAQNGAVTLDKYSGTYGETVTVTADPADGYILDTVLVDGEAIQGTTFTITGNHTVSALFEVDTTIYTVEVVQPNNGTVAVDRTSGLRGDTVIVTATPDEGYKLWTILVDGAAAGSTFTIRGSHTVTALFVPEGFVFDEDETAPVLIPGPQKEEPEEPFSLYNANMELGNSLTMYFYFKQADIDPAKDYYVTITKTYADGRADVIKTIPEEDWIATTDDDGVQVYRVGFDGIAAKEMADDLKVQVFTTDGNPASNLLTYNIRAYAMTMLEYFPSGELATLFVDMLNYGAAAQTFFGYNTGDLANAQLTEEQQALATQSVEPVSNRVVGDMYYNVSLQLESKILLQMYFENVTSDMYAKVTFTDHYGTQKSAVVPFEKFHHVSGTNYYIDVEGLAVADGRQLVTCELYNGNDELVGSGTDSVESYIATMNSVAPDALYTQIMKFIDSAYRYFH